MSFWDRLVEEAQSLGELLLEWAILLGVALVVLIIGRWILKLLRTIIERAMGASMLDGLWERSGVSRALAHTEQTPASITATIVYAYLMIGLFLIVTRVMRLDTIEKLLENLLIWIPQLLLAAVIIIVTAAAAQWIRGLVQPMATQRGVGWVGAGVYVAVLIFGVLFALDVINITFAEDIVKILVTAFAVAMAVAFGVGGIDTAKKWWARYGTPDNSSGGGSFPSAEDNSPSGDMGSHSSDF